VTLPFLVNQPSATMTSTISPTGAAVDQIVRLIRERGLRPGDQLPSIRNLAETLDQSISAVRNALLQAQARGLIKVLPRAGAFIQAVVPAEDPTAGKDSGYAWPVMFATKQYNLFHLLDARKVIELELAGRAAEVHRLEDLEPLRRTLEKMADIPLLERRANYVDLDIQFHVQVARLARTAVLADVLATLLEQLRPYLERLPWSPDRRRQTDRSHAQLYEALVEGKKDRVRSEVIEHLDAAYNSLLNELRTPPAQLQSELG